MEVISLSLIKFLNEWEVRTFVILSLMLQILLIMLGNRRKYVCKLWIRVIIWCAYVLADWVAIVSLGIIAKNTLEECQKEEMDDDLGIELRWLWAQFFLLHLGGPDTITAYSLEDNELWLRRVLEMLIQTGLALYVLLVAFPGSYWLPSLSVLVFIAGVIKYGERLATLCAASSENFRDSMLPEPEAGPNYPKFMEEYTLKKAEGYVVEVDEVKEENYVLDNHDCHNGPPLCVAYCMFLTFKRLFADSILSFKDRDSSKSYFQERTAQDAFDVVEIELSFMFDQLYTKASVVYNLRGCVLRMITFSLTLSTCLVFQFVSEKRNYSTLDLGITQLLLWVAVFLEIYGVGLLLCSDWTRCRLSRLDKTSPLGQGILWMRCKCNNACPLGRVMQWFQQPMKRWSNKMAQHNLLNLCLGDKYVACPRSHTFLSSLRRRIKLDHYLEKHWHKSFVDVSIDLKELIFKELKSYTSGSDPASMWSRKESFTLAKYSLSLDWMNEREFDQRILLWHIATDICYSHESSENETAEQSKQISNYMLYLLIAYPFMLPIGIGMIRFRDTCAEAREFLRERDSTRFTTAEACKKFLAVNTEVPPGKVKGDRSKSVLFDACILAKSLLEEEVQQRWEIISKVWVEMLAHAATNCSSSHHAGQLRKGGELLTHVWLLMAHLGITEQFQISKGHARPKMAAL